MSSNIGIEVGERTAFGACEVPLQFTSLVHVSPIDHI